jgi:hypothetical protein
LCAVAVSIKAMRPREEMIRTERITLDKSKD